MKQQTTKARAHSEMEHIFRVLLPAKGMNVREEQVRLCHEMLDALVDGKIALCDAGVGIGKTYAYLIACVLLRRFWPSEHLSTVTVSTASVALQNAILKEYIPFLSDVLLQGNVIASPLRAVVRKGKERFVCDARLAVRLEAIKKKTKNQRQQSAVFSLRHQFELDAVPNLSGFDRRLVCVPAICPKDCPDKGTCRFHRYLLCAKSNGVFLQICNHNYLLADAHHRQHGIPPLLRDSQAVIVDEAHKLPEAARQMYNHSVTLEKLFRLADWLEEESFTRTGQRLRENSEALFASLALQDESATGSVAYTAAPENRAALRGTVRGLRGASRNLRGKVPQELLNRLEENAEVLSFFEGDNEQYIRYIEFENGRAIGLCAVNRNLPLLVKEALWVGSVPTILTSGTLAAGNSFTRAKQQTGLTDCARLCETRALSPFHYEENCLLFFPGGGNTAEQILSIIRATHGHTLVLFTSYAMMFAVSHQMNNKLTYPLYLAWRNDIQTSVQAFKNQPNAVLFAAGSCWEGMDFPGDMVSSLILAKLPFPIPNPVREEARKNYSSLQGYIRTEIVPDMQIKLRQGFGRAIRTETDTCAISILDHRAAPGGRYHQAVMQALPEMPITRNLDEVESFIRKKKSLDYFRGRKTK